MPGKKLLDIGSGSGQFLYEMKTLGMEVHGIEPGSFDAKVAKKENLDIIKSNLDKTRYKSNCFDLITINHVLEHVNNPVETLKEAYRILKKDGLLIIGVPNNKSLAYWIFKKNWYQLDAPRHLFDYSERNLTKKLKELGFRIKKIRHNSRPSQFLVSFSYLLGKRIKILNMLLFPLALLMTYIVNIFKIGDQIEIYCTK